MSQKYIGFATTLKRGNGDGPPETYTAIAGVRSVDPPKGTATIVEATTMDNPNAFKEYIAGLRDAGPITFQLATDPADTGFQHVIQDWVNGILRDWQIVLSDGTALADLRYTLETDQGSLLYVQGQGVRHGSADVLARLARGEDVDASELTTTV